MSKLITGLILGAATAGASAALCFLYGGGGTGIPGAVPVLVGNAGLVGFIAGLIAGPPSAS
jgi:hypothetical protein